MYQTGRGNTQTIPHRMYEAAEVDGAGFWQKFFKITLPLLKPTIVFVTIMSCIVSFQVFEQIYVMTGGGGGQLGGVLDCALTAVPYLFDRGFNKFQMGYASALAYILFLLIFTPALANITIMITRTKPMSADMNPHLIQKGNSLGLRMSK